MSPQRIRELIDDSETLAAFCDQLAASSYITIDTEFIRDRTYWPRLSLFETGGRYGEQVSWHQAVFEPS